MILNILHLNIESDRHLDSVFKLLEDKKPNIVCLAEVLEKDAKSIASKLGYQYTFAPLVSIKNGDEVNEEGSAILSKFPIKETNKYRYDDNDTKEPPIRDANQIVSKDGVRPKDRFAYFNTLLTATIEIEGKQLTISTTHFPVVDHISSGFKDHELKKFEDVIELERAEGDLDRLIKIIRELKYPLIFTADLNNARGEFFYDAIAHELNDIVPSSVNSTIDPHLHRIPSLMMVIDTIMISPDISIESFEVIDNVSDHKALLASLNI